MRFQGLYTVLITPFTDQGELDIPGLRLLIRRQIEAKVDGIVAIGTTGESPTLTDEETEIILKITREETRGMVQWIVGTGTFSTAKSVALTRRAYELGADGAMIINPYYNRPTQEGLYQHYWALNECGIPLIVYNHQGRTGVNITTETLRRIADLDNVVAVKEASGNMQQIIELIAEMRGKDFAVLSGDDALTLPLMALGGHGILSVVSNLVPEEMRALVDALQEKDLTKAQEIHHQLMPFFRAINLETNPIPIKMMMHMEGLPAGSCRLPLTDLDERYLPQVERILNKARSTFMTR